MGDRHAPESAIGMGRITQSSKDPVEQAASQVEKGSVGLPVGVQVASRRWREDVVLAVMSALESRFRTQADYPTQPPI